MRTDVESARQLGRAASLVGIALVSASLGMLVSWRAPGLDLYARDWLMRARGPLAPPSDIAIVAIDEASIARFGRFPWPRSVLARTIGAVGAAHPKVIALDVLFIEPTSASEDNALADAITRAGNVVSAVQLTRKATGEVVWLRPFAAVEQASAAIGHVNVSTELEGVARQLLVREADDNGNAFWAMPIEAVRVADGASRESLDDSEGTIRVGSHSVTTSSSSSSITFDPGRTGGMQKVGARQMTIDYVGPDGSFEPYTFSVTDLLDGRVQASQLQGKYVLIGATAASLGDRVASPFVHIDRGGDRQHGSLMPGVEVLANSINTILRSRFYWTVPDWLAFLLAATVALIAAFTLSIGHSRYEGLKQVFLLIALCIGLLVSAYFAFTHWLIVPPLAPVLVSFAAAAPLALVRRAMIASAGLDERIRELTRAEAWLWPAVNTEAESREPSAIWSLLPRGVGWKSRALGLLNRRLLARARFVDRAMRSVEDGLMVSDLDGRIVFVNRRAAEILETTERTLLGSGLLERLGESADTAKKTLARLLEDRVPVENEVTRGSNLKKHYNLRLSPVVDDGDGSPAVIGLVASLSDITKQYELQQMKTDVMALVTHELRTPLTAIQGISEVLNQFEVDPQRRREMHAAINEEAKRLARMIDEYLDITKLESGVRPLRLAPVRIASLVERALLLLDPIAAQRGITIVRQFAGELPPVLVDSDLLARALTNLVANAIKYSPPKTDVTVALRAGGGVVDIEVTDHGCGIPAEHLGRIFAKFYRVPRVEDVETPGTGLGLAMVREIMDAHHGAVTVKSAPGAGSTFTLRLPATLTNESG